MKLSAFPAMPLAACILAVSGASHVFAQDFVAGASYRNGTLTILSDTGFTRSIYAPNGVPSFASLGRLPDGDYTYQLSAASNQLVRVAAPQNDGRGAAATDVVRQGASQSGTFQVRGGAIVFPAAGRANDNGDQD